jgi:acyl transferase domain-containing protein/3-hydroxymyristoyl/3-hydroxydecanoyl-(acyl carrier protein) dehydratase/NAD(P)-dependent dehydrogenase (short-subunit alcohol dehydrogenase family)/acyl carrier protein
MKAIDQNTSTKAVAIIGIGCIFPKSCNLKEYWHLLFNGVDAIEDIPDKTHWKLKDYFDQDPATPDHTYCTRGGFIPAKAFDPLSYGIPPKNLEATDTSQLLGLEAARMALEDAGYPVNHPYLKEKKVNVIIGVTGTQELALPLGARLGHPIWKKALEDSGINPEKKEEIIHRIQNSYVQWQENSFPGLLGNVVAGRIANRLNLSGTNAVTDAACASSLIAIHTAVMELLSHKCDMSVTGGVDTLNDIFMHMCFSKTGVLSHTSDARPFSKDADGTVLGEGIGMLILKRLEDAQKDKNRIYAVIKGVGTSSDGKTSAIYAPETKGQLKALKDAYDQAGIEPSTVEFVEAHGTGTRVGDKVEFKALKACFDHGNLKNANAAKNIPVTRNTTAIGSVKSMIGHTKAAAGAAGIIKATLALYNKVIPPTLKADTPDPELDINNSSFYLNSQTKPWIPKPDATHPRRSGVSAFGFGGSNFHVVLEEYDKVKSHVSWDGAVQIIAFSSNKKDDLIHQVNAFKKQVKTNIDIGSGIDSHPDFDEGENTLAIAWLAFESRQQFSCDDEFRLLVVLKKQDNILGLIDKAILAVTKEEISQGPVFFAMGKPIGKLGFLFPGQGSQYTGMGKDLTSVFPEAMEALSLAQTCFTKTNNSYKFLTDYIFPLPKHLQVKTLSEENLRRTDIAQPALGAISLAMIDVLKRFKITPQMTCGHSFGELSALHAAEWIDRKTFIKLAAARGKYMADAGKTNKDSGSMLAVQAPLKDIEDLIRDENLDLVLANKNSNSQGVLSGPTHEIDKANTICKLKKMRAVKLPVAAAFHSRLVKEAAIPFKRYISDKSFTPTKIDVLSNTKGSPYPTDTDGIKKILGDQLMLPVDFITNIKQMYKNGISTFVEVGPKSVLTGLVKDILKNKNITALSLDASAGKKSGLEDLALTLCAIAAKGFSLDLTQWEEPVKQPQKKKMKVMLSGANIKPARTPDIQSLAVTSVQKENIKPNIKNEKQILEQTCSKPDRTALEGSNMTLSRPSQQNQTAFTAPSNEAMHLVQKGLESMQQLQAQTARAHEKFLDTQAQASKTLANMMEHTREFVSISPDSARIYSSPSDFVTPSSQTAPQTFVPDENHTGETLPLTETMEKIKSRKHDISNNGTPEVHAQIRPETFKSNAPTPSLTALPLPVQEILFKIVSQLTGFPVEMLEPDMDIESDLGIDSIKKVEIISELEKQIPKGKTLSTDHMGSVKTLNDLCIAIGEETPAPAEVTAPSEVSPLSAIPAANFDAGPDDSGKIFTTLVEIISELTGFPIEMLEPDMNLESDLGIDSIKRVEILSKLEQELDDINSISSDDMADLKTIQDIVQFLNPNNQVANQVANQAANQVANQAVSTGAVKKKTSDFTRDKNLTHSNTESGQNVIVRQEITLKKFPTNQIRFYNGAKIELPPKKKVYLTRDKAKLADHFKQIFESQGIPAELIDISQGKIPDLPDAAGIVIIPDSFKNSKSQAAKAFLKSAFCLSQKNASHLMSAASEKGAFLATISFFGGGFGFSSPTFLSNPIYGGLAGLAKTAGLEWKNVLCRALDMPDSVEKCIENAEAAVSLMMTHGEVEMGLDDDNCNIPTLETRQIQKGVVNLDQDDVVIITGGAKGVTAECAVQLAKEYCPRIILLGRSPAPFLEPDWIQGITDLAEMKKQILIHGFIDQKPKPAEIEKQYKAILSNREIQANIDRIKACGSQVKYISADIRDKKEIKKIFAGIRKKFSRISAIIHGAGVLEDKLIVDKGLDQFNRVFDTKVEGLDALLAATKDDPIKYFILFSSIAARVGNKGQCDYAMANEALNKTAQKLAIDKPDCRFLSINWGPWAGGMVDDGLKREFFKKRVDLIPLDQGALQLLKEMGNPDTKTIEVVISAKVAQDTPVKEPVLAMVLKQTFGQEASPIIESHKIAQEPVVPFALIVELLAHAAEKNNPGLTFAGMDDMRLLKGIKSKDDGIEVQVNLGKCIPWESGFKTHGNLISQEHGENSLKHASSIIILKNHLPKPPMLSKAGFMDLMPYSLSIKQAYENILFHGKDLQCIIDINGVSDKGIEVVTRLAPKPEQWFKQPHSKRWAVDPMMLDAAFQAAILWSHETRKQVCLPSYMANLRLYASHERLKGKVRILFTVNEETQHKIKGYFTFLDETQTVVASITGFEAIVDPSLMAKFKNTPLFSRESILAFAQGNPSEAFGDKYKIFDGKKEIARLPRPPYFFMDRVLKADHPQWKMQPGGWIETQYDIPDNAWYFTANRTQTMPFSILLEIALQPCGWLAAYAGSALQSADRLHFRNLGGKARMFETIANDSGTLTVRSRMTDVSKAGGMIIQDFEMEVNNNGKLVYQGTTNFGFFTKESLANQVGIRNSELNIDFPSHTTPPYHIFNDDAPLTPKDKNHSDNSGMPSKALRMIDSIEQMDLQGGIYEKGYIKAVKKVDPKEWFFDAHFYQDPVCPGSLGVESFLQMLRFFLLEKFNIPGDEYAMQMTPNHNHEWIYRGQIIPSNKTIEIQAHIKEISDISNRYSVIADGVLNVDNICIYEMKNFSVEFIPLSQTVDKHLLNKAPEQK